MAYIFFDIDGTLWDEKMQIPESTIPTIRQLQKNGHKTFLCSGRSRSNINDKRLLGIGFDGIVAACGNHVEMDGKVLYENILSPELTEKIVRVMEECRMPIVLEGPDCHWIDKENFRTDPYVLYLQILTTTPVGEQQVADKVHLMLLSTDTTKAPQERVARQTTKHGLYNALDIGSIWLQKANAQ